MFVWLHPLLTFGTPLVGIRFSRVIGSPVYLICILWIAVPILITSGIASLFCSFSLEVCLGFSRGKVFRHGLLSFPLTIFTYFGAHAARTGIPRFKIKRASIARHHCKQNIVRYYNIGDMVFQLLWSRSHQGIYAFSWFLPCMGGCIPCIFRCFSSYCSWLVVGLSPCLGWKS